MGIGGKAKYYGHDLTKEAWNRSWKRQELLAGQAEEEEMYSGGGSDVCTGSSRLCGGLWERLSQVQEWQEERPAERSPEDGQIRGAQDKTG